MFHCAGRVIQGRVEIEEALLAERRQLADAQHIALVGSWELDLDTGVRTWSTQQHRNHGFEPSPTAPSWDAFLGRIHPEDRAAFATNVRRLQAEPAPFATEYRVVLPDASIRQITVEGRPVVEDGRANRLIGTSRDVTAERDAERLKDEFIGLVSHELRTPLTSIIGYTELLAETESRNLTDQGQRFVEVIDRNSRRELALVGDLLMLTKISAGTFTIEPTSADIGEIARATYEAAKPEAVKAGVELSLHVNGAPVITGDPDRLAQVAENLLSNARQVHPGGRPGVDQRRPGWRRGRSRGRRYGHRHPRRGVAAAIRAHVPGGRGRAPPHPGHRAWPDDRQGDRRCARRPHHRRERAAARRHVSRRAPGERAPGAGLMRVELLWWSGCPSSSEAIDLVREQMGAAGLDAQELDVREIHDEAEAERERFPGSPTVRVEGVDAVDPQDAPIGLTCRVYRLRDGRISALPDPEDVAAALVAARDGGE